MQRERGRACKGGGTREGTSRWLASLWTRLLVLGTFGCGRLGAGDADTLRPGFLPASMRVSANLPREICFDKIKPGDTVSVLLHPGQFQQRGIRDEEWPRRFAMRLRWARVEMWDDFALVPFSGDINGAPIDQTVARGFLPEFSTADRTRPSGCMAASRWLSGEILQHGLAWTGPSMADSMPASP